MPSQGIDPLWMVGFAANLAARPVASASPIWGILSHVATIAMLNFDTSSKLFSEFSTSRNLLTRTVYEDPRRDRSQHRD
jgi:hypothetical protein